MGAHHGEVRFCETKAESPVEGDVAIAMTVGGEGLLVASEANTPTVLPTPVVDCIRNATRRWKFPQQLFGRTFTYRFQLPVAGNFPGPG